MKPLDRAGSASTLTPRSSEAETLPPERAAPPTADADSPTPPPYPLFQRFPNLAKHLPRAVLTNLPTPCTPLPALAAELGLASLTVKRDDVSAEPYGGGKPRKLELIFGAVQHRGRTGVATFGGVGSHHAAATAIYAKRLGLACRLWLIPQPPTEEVRRVLLTSVGHDAVVALAGSLPSAQRRALKLGEAFAIVAAGGSSIVGNIGFVNAGLELARQVATGHAQRPDVVYTAVGTMGSAVGLVIGLALAGLDCQVIGVRTASWSAASPRKFRALHGDTVRWLREHDPQVPELRLTAQQFRFENRFLGSGYAVPTRRGADATRRAAAVGLRLDSTYTAKAFAALLGTAEQHRDRHVLFWHSHSQRPLPANGSVSDLPPTLRGYATTSRP